MSSGRSSQTIEVHRRNVMTKLNAANLVDLVKRSKQVDEVARVSSDWTHADTIG